jgi:hypothetical protein
MRATATSARCALFIALLVAAANAHAGDGVLEINHVCAQSLGCFPGDLPNYPVTIDGSAGRSYRLTSDLSVNANTTAISITADDVSIDLNGHSIRGPNTCSVVVCTFPGLGDGIASTNKGVSVGNGSVTGMGRDGISLGDIARIFQVRVRWSGRWGIDVGGGSIVEGSSASQNRLVGIRAFEFGSTVSGNVAVQNGTFGLDLSSSTSYRGNTLSLNDTTNVLGGVNTGGNSCDTVVCP